MSQTCSAKNRSCSSIIQCRSSVRLICSNIRQKTVWQLHYNMGQFKYCQTKFNQANVRPFSNSFFKGHIHQIGELSRIQEHFQTKWWNSSTYFLTLADLLKRSSRQFSNNWGSLPTHILKVIFWPKYLITRNSTKLVF